jgi:N-methylhydantoinase B
MTAMDPVLTEIMKNRFSAIAEEASTSAMRAAHTTFVKLTQDFQVAVANTEGDFFAFPVLTGTVSGGGQSIKGIIRHFPPEQLNPGDVIISNDPFSTGGIITHMMDVHMVRPVFVDDEIVAYAWSFIHASDIGGAVPGSISPELYECFQEGFRLRPTKLVDRGTVNAHIANFIMDNSRISSAIWGDLEALMAAMRLLEARINEMCAKIGVEAFRQGIRDVMAYAEMKARRVISGMTDGVYEFSDYLEGTSDGELIMIKCQLTVDGDEARIDYTGTSPEVYAAFNYTSGNRTHPFLFLALSNYIQSIEPDTPPNGGFVRPITTYAPPGTLINAEFPAAMGNRWVAVMRTYDALMGCINQAVPGGVVACGAGQAGIISASWSDAHTGASRVAVVEPFSGGSGGRMKSDGVDANDTMIGHLRSTPIEHVESEIPLLVRRHEYVPQRFGHGQYRSGASVCIELECVAHEVKITARGLDRLRLQPWGVEGGHPGWTCVVSLIRDGVEEDIGRIKVLTLKAGDLLRMVSSSGGGFGDPEDRAPARVLRDVLDGLLTVEEADAVYGLSVDVAARSCWPLPGRRAAAEQIPAAVRFCLGEARMQHEERWPADATVALSNGILALPKGMRHVVRQLVVADLSGHSRVDEATVAESIRRNAHSRRPGMAI